uniref:Uncharacterized protein n=1 Tax=Ditylenchus dipsaci TaxID=166011 RepID=A0A915DLS0_9BILA
MKFCCATRVTREYEGSITKLKSKRHSEKEEDAASSMIQENKDGISVNPLPSKFPTTPDKSMSEGQVANKFGVHILIIDSTSQTQFCRSMQKTVYLLREEYGAIPFYYLNTK